MSELEEISTIQSRIMDKYSKLRKQKPPPKSESETINKLATYMLNHSNLPASIVDKEIADLNLKSGQQQILINAVQSYGNQLKENIEEGQGLYFWLPGAERNVRGFKINKALLGGILLKSIIEKLAQYIYNSLNQRKQKALKVRKFTSSVREHKILTTRHLPYFISESVYFRQVNKLDSKDQKRKQTRAKTAPLLIWNGFGNEKLEWYHDEIFSLLTARIKNNRPIIFVSDWDFDVFANQDYAHNLAKLKKKGGRIASRVVGMCNELIFKLEAESKGKEES